MPPEIREGRGEIEAAKGGKLPNLIELSDIKGDLHIHSKYSDGSNSIEEMVRAAIKLYREYIAITDHSKSQAIARGLDQKRLRQQWHEIERLRKKYRQIKILKGSEVDILLSGDLDFDNKILSQFDIVIASVHSAFKSPEKEMTKRIIKALENKYVTILAHPTGRIINRRPPYAVDLEQIFEIAREKKKLLEISAQTQRLDLNDINIKLAKEKGVEFVINTDSHSTEQLNWMLLGVSQARRGWIEKSDVVNTLKFRDLSKRLKLEI
ncbi:MAG: PHP domain-containing protein [Nanoarchaeota archaeon]